MLPRTLLAVGVSTVLAACKPEATAVAPTPAPEPSGPNRLFYWRDHHIRSLAPTGEGERLVLAPHNLPPHPAYPTAPPVQEPYDPHTFAVTRDGKRVAVVAVGRGHDPAGLGVPRVLVVRPTAGAGPTSEIEVGESADTPGFAVWSADGNELVISRRDTPDTRYVFNVKTRTRTPLPLPAGSVVTDISPDGRFLLTEPAGLWERTKDGLKKWPLAGDSYWGEFDGGRFSPDGKRVLAVAYRTPQRISPDEQAARARLGLPPARPPIELFVRELATGKATPLKEQPSNAEVYAFCWSPDGRRVAYLWHEWTPRDRVFPTGEDRFYLTVCDADGSNPRAVLSVNGPRDRTFIACLDWR